MSLFALNLPDTRLPGLATRVALAVALTAAVGAMAAQAAAHPQLMKLGVLMVCATVLLGLAVRMPPTVLPLALVVGLLGLGNLELSRIVAVPMLGGQEKWVLLVLVGVAALGAAADASAGRRPAWPPTLLLGALFLVVSVGSLLYAADRDLAGSAVIHQVVQMAALAAGFFWVRRAREANALVACLAVVGTVSAALGVWQFLTPTGFNAVFGPFASEDIRFFMDYWALDMGRVGALWGYAPPFAAFLSALLPAFLYLWLRHTTSWRAFFAIAGFVLTMVALIQTGTRMEFIGGVAAVLLMLFAWRTRSNGLSGLRVGAVPALAAALVVAGVLSAQASAESNVFERFLLLVQGDPATTDMVSQRKVVYGSLLDTWRSNPVLGVGLGNTQGATQEATAFSGWRSLTSPHSYYLGLLAQTGLVGTGLVALMLVAMVPHYRRLLRQATVSRRRAFAAFAAAASLAVLVGGVADNAMLYVWQIGVIFWLLQGAVLSLSLRSEERTDIYAEERSKQEASNAR